MPSKAGARDRQASSASSATSSETSPAPKRLKGGPGAVEMNNDKQEEEDKKEEEEEEEEKEEEQKEDQEEREGGDGEDNEGEEGEDAEEEGEERKAQADKKKYIWPPIQCQLEGWKAEAKEVSHSVSSSLSSSSIEKGVADLITSNLTPSLHSCWLPIIMTDEERAALPSPTSTVISKFGGSPYLKADEKWPQCKCKGGDNRIPFFMQIRVADLPPLLQSALPPAGSSPSTLFQFFWCSGCDDYDGNREGRVIRWVTPTEAEIVSPPAPPAGPLPSMRMDGAADGNPLMFKEEAKLLKGWEEKEDWPGQEDIAAFKEQRAEGGEGEEEEEEGAEPEEDGEEDDRLVRGDKLSGFGEYVQSKPDRRCPHCDRPMDLFFNIDSERIFDNWAWGDAGTAQIFQCRQHREEFEFDWACG